MKIKRIELLNFRFFYGVHEIEFSSDHKKPLTVFIGENTGGKSSVLIPSIGVFLGSYFQGQKILMK
jgi:predicted ATP-dependent endonuclease of OLD family